ncbi:MAG: hypothetical protein ACLUOF_09705 [Ruminococcus sp.]
MCGILKISLLWKAAAYPQINAVIKWKGGSHGKGKTKDGLEYLWTDKKRTLFGLPLSFTRYYLTESRLITRVGLLTDRWR